MKSILRLAVNGEKKEAAVDSSTTLVSFLRETLGLTGTKIGCGEGECGACTVLLDGIPVASCLVLALECQDRQVVTIEGIADGADLHPLQRAFVAHGAVQCGYCTPGMILSAKALLDENPAPDEAEIRAALAGNLCRCTGYQKIIEAVQAAADEIRAKR